MSSSSCVPENAVDLFRRALRIVRDESPQHADMIASALRDFRIVLQVGDELITLKSDGRVTEVFGEASLEERFDVLVRSSLVVALAIVCGNMSVLEAVRRSDLTVTGKIDALDRAARILEVFVHGVARCSNGYSLVKDLEMMAQKRPMEAA